MKKDIFHQLLVVPAITPIAITANGDTIQTPVFDTAGFEALNFAVDLTDYTDGDYQLVILESDDPAFATSNDTAAISQLPIDTVQSISAVGAIQVGYVGHKRFVKLKIVSTNVTTGATMGSIGIFGRPNEAPVN